MFPAEPLDIQDYPIFDGAFVHTSLGYTRLTSLPIGNGRIRTPRASGAQALNTYPLDPLVRSEVPKLWLCLKPLRSCSRKYEYEPVD